MLKGSQFRTRKIEESFLPACRWILNEEGKWRKIKTPSPTPTPIETSSISHYEEVIVFPLNIELPAYNEIDYETNFKCKKEIIVIYYSNYFFKIFSPKLVEG